MKQPQAPKESVTKQDFIMFKEQFFQAFEIFEERIEKRLEKRLIEKLEKLIDSKIASSEARMAIRFADFEQKIDDKFRHYNSDILIRFDAVVKQLRDERVDQSVITAKINKNQLVLKDHEKRINKLESEKN